METIKVEDSFVSYIRELICDQLDVLEANEHDDVYASDFRFEVMDDSELVNGGMFDEEGAFDFLRTYPYAALACIDYTKFNFGSDELPYLFESWVGFAEKVVLFGVECMTYNLPLVDSRICDDDLIAFDHETVATLKEQVATAGITY